MDPYKILGVAPDATDEQIKAAYRDLAASTIRTTMPTIRWQTLLRRK